MTVYKHWSLLSLMTLSLIACGGGTSSQDGSSTPTAGLEGRVTINGGLAGATIFVDLNGSESLDEDEPVGYTDSQGFFGYNPVTRVNYCKSDSLALRKHCLRLPSLDNLPDDVTIFYMGGIKLASGEQNDKVYRYHVQVDQLRGKELDLNAAKALVSAISDSDESEDILYAIIDAFYQKYQPDPVGLVARSFSPFSMDDLTAAEKFEALKAAGVFAGLDNDTRLDPDASRADVTRILALMLQLEDAPPSQQTFIDVPGSEWAYGFISAAAAAELLSGTGSAFTPQGNITQEQLAVIVAKALGLEPTESVELDGVAAWAKGYLEVAAINGLMPPVADYRTPQIRELLMQSVLQGRESWAPEDAPVTQNLSIFAIQEMAQSLASDQPLNDSFSEADFDQLLNGLPALLQEAAVTSSSLNLVEFRSFLLDAARDWTAWQSQDFSAFLLDSNFFDAAVAGLQGKVMEIGYSHPNKGYGRLQLLLTEGDSQSLTGGRVQACIFYEEYDVPERDQLFAQPMYVSGDWARVNDNALALNLNVIPGYAYTRVLQLDWTQITSDVAEMTTIGFDLGNVLDAWQFTLLPGVDHRWQTLDDNQAAANATCEIFLD